MQHPAGAPTQQLFWRGSPVSGNLPPQLQALFAARDEQELQQLLDALMVQMHSPGGGPVDPSSLQFRNLTEAGGQGFVCGWSAACSEV